MLGPKKESGRMFQKGAPYTAIVSLAVVVAM